MSPVVEGAIKSKKAARSEKKRSSIPVKPSPTDEPIQGETKQGPTSKKAKGFEESTEVASGDATKTLKESQSEGMKSKKQTIIDDQVEFKEEVISAKKTLDEDDKFDFVEAGFSFAPVSSKNNTEKHFEDDGLKIIEPKTNKKKLTVDDITALDKEKEEKNKRRKVLEKRSQYSVWVGNLRYSTDEAALKQFFSSCGTITSIKLPFVSGKNKGFAFIFFESQESVEKAIALSEQELDGRNLLIKNANNFKKDGAKPPPRKPIPGESDMEAFPTLFIGNLSFLTTKKGLQEKFSKFGEIKKVRISTFEDTGRCKGYAWIDFKTQAAATLALRSTQKMYLDGHLIKVAYAKESSVKRGSNFPQYHPNFKRFDGPGNTA